MDLELVSFGDEVPPVVVVVALPRDGRSRLQVKKVPKDVVSNFVAGCFLGRVDGYGVEQDFVNAFVALGPVEGIEGVAAETLDADKHGGATDQNGLPVFGGDM